MGSDWSKNKGGEEEKKKDRNGGPNEKQSDSSSSSDDELAPAVDEGQSECAGGTPKTLRSDLDPRSPAGQIGRTPIQVKPRKAGLYGKLLTKNAEMSGDVTPNKHLSLAVDPRSPSGTCPRTPIVVKDRKEEEEKHQDLQGSIEGEGTERSVDPVAAKAKEGKHELMLEDVPAGGGGDGGGDGAFGPAPEQKQIVETSLSYHCLQPKMTCTQEAMQGFGNTTAPLFKFTVDTAALVDLLENELSEIEEAVAQIDLGAKPDEPLPECCPDEAGSVTGSSAEQSDSTGSTAEQSDSTGSTADESGSTGSSAEQSDSTGSSAEQSDSTGFSAEQSDSTGSTADESGSVTGSSADESISVTGCTADESISVTGCTADESISETGCTADESISETGCTADESISVTGATSVQAIDYYALSDSHFSGGEHDSEKENQPTDDQSSAPENLPLSVESGDTQVLDLQTTKAKQGKNKRSRRKHAKLT